MHGFNMMAERYECFLAAEATKHASAYKLGLKECQRCGFCCLRRPCAPTPDELPPIAKHLGISVHDLVKRYMVADSQTGAPYFLRWIQKGQEDVAGTYITTVRTYDRGYCIFFDQVNHVCAIYPVAPRDATEWSCWGEQPQTREEVLRSALQWSYEKVLKYLPDFNPNEDEEEEDEDFDMGVVLGSHF